MFVRTHRTQQEQWQLNCCQLISVSLYLQDDTLGTWSLVSHYGMLIGSDIWYMPFRVW